MATDFRMAALLVAGLAFPLPGTAQSVSNLRLDEILDVTVQSHSGDTTGAETIPYQSSGWLAAVPAVSISYLASDEAEGTDETEVRLNLPMKPGFARKADQQLRTLSAEISTVETQRRRLYFSGLVREAIWSERIASTQAQYAQKKMTLLEDLLQRQQVLLKAHSASRYSLLLIRQELTDARLVQQEHLWQANNWVQRYRQLTGLGGMPPEIFEAPSPTQLSYTIHPQLQLLDLSWKRQQQLIAATSSQSTPWNVALTAKQLQNPQFDENQYGVSLDIPLSVFEMSSESTVSEWREASRIYWQQRDELQLELQRSWEGLAREALYLEQRQTLLDKAALISSDLIKETQTLMGQNELRREIWIRRALGDLDKQAYAAINKLLTGQNHAMTRQAAGIPL